MTSPLQGLLRRLAAIALVVSLHHGASATYSGLALIPTADVVGAGQFSIEWQMDGPAPADSPDTYYLNTQFGLGDRAEAGVDYDNSDGADPRVFLNAKVVVASDDRKGRALALGVYNVAEGARGWGYAVGLVPVGRVRLHPGVIAAWRHCHAIIGVDAPVGPKTTLMADYTGGAHNCSSIALSQEFTDNLGVTAGYCWPNSGGEARFTLILGWCGALKR